MIILGIDPGLASTGFGVIDHQQGHSKYIDAGTVLTRAGEPLPDRLKHIHNELVQVIEKWRPEVVAVEELFFANNAVSVMGVAQARGVAVLAACQPGISVVEYTPLQIKQSVTGSGRADKTQVHKMVEILLGLRREVGKDPASGAKSITTAHESDALAIALCHAQTGRLGALLGSGSTARTPGTQLPPGAHRKARRR